MKTTLIAALWIATSATTLPPTAAAHADPVTGYRFLSPSGNVGCTMVDHGDGTGEAVCKVREHTWLEPVRGYDALSLDRRGNGACAGAVASCLGPGTGLNFFTGPDPLPTLDYGHTHSEGPITCESESTGVTCTNDNTGHSIHASRNSYQLG